MSVDQTSNAKAEAVNTRVCADIVDERLNTQDRAIDAVQKSWQELQRRMNRLERALDGRSTIPYPTEPGETNALNKYAGRGPLFGDWKYKSATPTPPPIETRVGELERMVKNREETIERLTETIRAMRDTLKKVLDVDHVVVNGEEI